MAYENFIFAIAKHPAFEYPTIIGAFGRGLGAVYRFKDDNEKTITTKNALEWHNLILKYYPDAIFEYDEDNVRTVHNNPTTDPQTMKTVGLVDFEEGPMSSYNNNPIEPQKIYKTYYGWKRAALAKYPTAKFDGNKDIGAAYIEAGSPDRRYGVDVAEWDGEKGIVYEYMDNPTDPQTMKTVGLVAGGIAAAGLIYLMFAPKTAMAATPPVKVGPKNLPPPQPSGPPTPIVTPNTPPQPGFGPPLNRTPPVFMPAGTHAYVISDSSQESIQPIVDALNNVDLSKTGGVTNDSSRSFSSFTVSEGGPTDAEVEQYNSTLLNGLTTVGIVISSIDPDTQDLRINLAKVLDMKTKNLVILSPNQADDKVKAAFEFQRSQGHEIYEFVIPPEHAGSISDYAKSIYDGITNPSGLPMGTPLCQSTHQLEPIEERSI